ncbi:MAG: peptidase family [Actinoallomurus sp.]|nr:peptidase family [Actinoallomurus sp.]
MWSGVLLVVAALIRVPAGDGEAAWQWPLRPPPEVLRPFDPPAHPWEPGHRGVDLPARPGQPVYAAGAGRVGYARDLAGRGVVTVIHGGFRTTYLPVRPSVRSGQRVTAGTRIGVVENILGHCGQTTCLHWGLRQGVTYLDPLLLLGRAPVRLLPWWNHHATAGTDTSTPAWPESTADRTRRSTQTRPTDTTDPAGTSTRTWPTDTSTPSGP